MSPWQWHNYPAHCYIFNCFDKQNKNNKKYLKKIRCEVNLKLYNLMTTNNDRGLPSSNFLLVTKPNIA